MEYMHAALLLHKLGKPVNSESLKAVIKAAGGDADDGKIGSIVASLKDVDIDKELETASAAPVAAGSASGEAKEEAAEPEEEKKEEAAEGLSALFG